MEEEVTVREAFNRLTDLIAQGKGDWIMDIESRKTHKPIGGVAVIAKRKRESQDLYCLFG